MKKLRFGRSLFLILVSVLLLFGAMLPAYAASGPMDYVFVVRIAGSSGSYADTLVMRDELYASILAIWDENPDCTVTLIPYGRMAFTPLSGGGLDYDYVGSRFVWVGRSIVNENDILGYVVPSTMDASTVATPAAKAEVETSAYMHYNYLQMTSAQGLATDTVTPNGNTYLQNAILAMPYSEDNNMEAGFLAAQDIIDTYLTDATRDVAVVLLTPGGQPNRSFITEGDSTSGIYFDDTGDIGTNPFLQALEQARTSNNPNDWRAVYHNFSANETELNRAMTQATTAAKALTSSSRVSLTVLDTGSTGLTPQTAIRTAAGGSTTTPINTLAELNSFVTTAWGATLSAAVPSPDTSNTNLTIIPSTHSGSRAASAFGITDKTVYFNYNYDSAGTYLRVFANANGLVTRPADPVRAGYEFIGWFSDAACTQLWNFDTDIAYSGLELYAGWLSIVTDPPKTGDALNIAGAFMLLLAAGLTITRYRRRSRS